MHCNIRPVEQHELQELSELVHRSFLAHGATGWSSGAITTFLEESSPANLAARVITATLAVAAYSERQPVGFAVLSKPSTLGMLFVEPAHLRKGIGRKLWQFCLSRLSSLHPNVGTVHLNATPSAVPFYKALGFVSQGAEFERGGCRATQMSFTVLQSERHVV